MNIQKFDLKSAIFSIFPTRESFRDFFYSDKKGIRDISRRIISEAFQEGLIYDESEEALFGLLTSKTENAFDDLVPGNYTFSDLIDDIHPGSINHLVQIINDACKSYGFTKLTPVMVHRLKKDFRVDTPGKRMALRILAFWIGGKKPLLNWNYERLIQLENTEPGVKVDENEGVLVTFEIQGRGDVVEADAVQWLKDEIHHVINDAKHFKPRNVYIRPGYIRKRSLQSFCLKLPRKKEASGVYQSFAEAIKDALSICQQLCSRRFLSNYGERRNALIMAIAAGVFSDLDKHAQVLLKARIHGDPSIRLNEEAYLCARFAELKIGFHDPMVEKCVDEAHIRIWPVYYFWHQYFNCLPLLLSARAFPCDAVSYSVFREHLFFPESTKNCNLISISAIRKFPEKSRLMMEIVKVCFFRRMFHEADAVISMLLISDPDHPAARVVRMKVYLNLALADRDPEISEAFFQRAVMESRLIREKSQQDYEIWAEIGLLHWGKAVKILSDIRNNSEHVEVADDVKEKISASISEAAACFKRGASMSSSVFDNRCFYWLINTHALIQLLKGEPRIYEQGFCKDAGGVFNRTGFLFFKLAGWISESGEADGAISDADILALTRRLLAAMDEYQRSVMSRSLFPNILYACCTALWDLLPKHTVDVYHRVRNWLAAAREDARILGEENLGIFSCNSCFSEIVSPDTFIEAVDWAMERTTLKTIPGSCPEDKNIFLEDCIEDEGDLEKLNRMKLMLLNLDRVEKRRGVLFPINR